MASDDSAVIVELRLLRDQQWSMHRALVGRIDATDARLDSHATETRAGLASLATETRAGMASLASGLESLATETRAGMASLASGLESLAAQTRAGFAEVVSRADYRHTAFERFVELVIVDRREVRTELDGIKSRVDVLERKVG